MQTKDLEQIQLTYIKSENHIDLVIHKLNCVHSGLTALKSTIKLLNDATSVILSDWKNSSWVFNCNLATLVLLADLVFLCFDCIFLYLPKYISSFNPC